MACFGSQFRIFVEQLGGLRAHFQAERINRGSLVHGEAILVAAYAQHQRFRSIARWREETQIEVFARLDVAGNRLARHIVLIRYGNGGVLVGILRRNEQFLDAIILVHFVIAHRGAKGRRHVACVRLAPASSDNNFFQRAFGVLQRAQRQLRSLQSPDVSHFGLKFRRQRLVGSTRVGDLSFLGQINRANGIDLGNNGLSFCRIVMLHMERIRACNRLAVFIGNGYSNIGLAVLVPGRGHGTRARD